MWSGKGLIRISSTLRDALGGEKCFSKVLGQAWDSCEAKEFVSGALSSSPSRGLTPGQTTLPAQHFLNTSEALC